MPSSSPITGVRFLFRTFQYRNYRLFFAGQLTALTGHWMSLAALGWLVYRLTGDPLMLGLLGFFMHAPTFFLSPLGGVLSDRVDRRRIIITAHLLDIVTMLGLAGLTLSGRVETWHIFFACALLGIAKAFEMPARQALVVNIVEDPEKLSNAIALNSSIFHSARLLGPVVAGAVIIPLFGAHGEGICFLIGGIGYIAVIASMLALSIAPRKRLPRDKDIFGEMKEGFAYAFGFAPTRALILLMGAISLFGLPYATLLPIFARQILGGDSGTYGILMAAGGCGALIGALFLASRKSVLGLGRVIVLNTLTFGVALALFAVSTQVWLSTALLLLAGGSSLTAIVATNTIIQTLVDDRRRGRVMSLFGMTFMGALPIGALVFGKSASAIGAPTTIVIAAMLCMVAGGAFAWSLPTIRRVARPVYVKRGILPDESPRTHA